MGKSEFENAGMWDSASKKVTYKRTPTGRELSLHLENLYRAQEPSTLEIVFPHGRWTYMLFLEYNKQNANPSWKFYRNDSSEPNLLWERDSNDGTMIHNLVSSTIDNSMGELIQSAKKTEKARSSLYQEKLDVPPIQSGLLANIKRILGMPETVGSAALVDLSMGRDTLGQIALTDLGILSYPAFLFCLTKEFKLNDENLPLTVLVFRLTLSGKNRSLHLPKPIIKEILARVKKLQRKTDVIGQYDVPNTFAVMLPEIDLDGAKYFAKRLETMLNKLSAQNKFSNGFIKSTFALATISDRCDSVEKILGAADITLAQVEREGLSVGAFDQCFPKNAAPSKNINQDIVQNMIGQFIVQPYGIFSYSALIAFMEHHFERAKRTKRKTYVLVINLVKRQQKKDDADFLSKAKYLLVERIMAEDSRFLLAEYKENGIAIIAAKASLSNLPNFGKKMSKSLEETPLSTDEAMASYKIETKLYQIERDNNRPRIIKLTPEKTL